MPGGNKKVTLNFQLHVCLMCVTFLLPPSIKGLISDNLAILTYWIFKDTFFTFYKRDSATFNLLNCLDRKSLMSYKKDLNDTFQKIKNHACSLFVPKE